MTELSSTEAVEHLFCVVFTGEIVRKPKLLGRTPMDTLLRDRLDLLISKIASM